MKLDRVSIDIIKHLEDGRKSFKEISDVLSIPKNTVRSRVKKLEQEGILKISGSSFVYIGIKYLTMDLVAIGEKFSKLRGVLSVSVVTG